MHTWTSPSGRTTVVTPCGELDILTAPALRETLARALDRESLRVLMVDMADVTFIDSAGIGPMAFAARQARAKEIVFAMINPTSHLDRVLSLTGLHDLVLGHPLKAPKAHSSHG